jgi:hypothetical protein
MSNRQLATHLSAHVQHLTKCSRHEAANAVRELAITAALDTYGVNEQRAVVWLERCGVKYPKYHYQTALNRTRQRAVAAEVR